MRQTIQRLERNFCVTAGAGAGKTSCMVETYAGLLLGREGRPPLIPAQIAAITFTEAASNEMRARVLAKVSDLARSGRAGLDWPQMSAALEWAPISTIHAFCASLLREFGVLLGLDPDFAVLDQGDYDEILQAVKDDILRKALSGRDPLLGRLLVQFSLAGLGRALVSLHHELASAGVSADQARRATRQAHAQPLSRAPELAQDVGGSVLALAQSENLVNFKAKYGAKYKELIAAWPEIQKRLDLDPLETDALARLHGLLRGNWGKLNSLRRGADQVLEGLLALVPLPRARALADDLLALLAGMNQEVELELRRRAALSFDHLLLLSLRLLEERAEVLGELRGRWRALLVDEFQDVNPVQGRLVRLLAGLDDPSGYNPRPGEDPPRLLVVGDRKQSIYAFRGAEVAVFSRTMQEFPAEQRASLPENFRSAPELVGFFNRLFPNVFSDAEHWDNAPEAYVDFEDDDLQAPRAERMALSGRAVEVVRAGVDRDDPNAATRRALEAEALAGYLSRLTREEGVAPGDMVVLLRRLTQAAGYENALSRAGLDYYTVRGRGFFACQEVADVLMGLRVLLNPRDDLALAGFLRSPLVGLSDECLLALTHPAPDETRSLGDALARGAGPPAWVGPDQIRRWERARELISRLGPLARRLHPAEAMERLLEDTLAPAVLMGSSLGEQGAANLRKLLEIARQPRGALRGSLEAFTHGLAGLVADPPEDPQAPLMGEDAPVVRLMTIHQAKGLQFKVVVLADLDGQAGGSLGRGGLPAPGPGGVVALAPRDAASGLPQRSVLYKSLLARSRAREEAESARLFYVACTRAMERLAFVLIDSERRQGRWGKWVREHVLGDQAVSEIQADSLSRSASRETQAPARDWPDHTPTSPGPLADQGAEIAARSLTPPRPAASLARESVSSLENWFVCPRLYFYTRRLGLDTGALAPAGGRGTGASPDLDPVTLGSAVHQVLELADLAAGPRGLESALTLVCQGMGIGPEQAGKIRSLAAGVWDTRLAEIISSLPPENLMREQPFRLNLESGPGGARMEMIGEFDLLIVREGAPLIVDYKVSGDIHPEHYRDQLGLYALALWSGGQGGGSVPETALCYLRPQGARLEFLEFSQRDLQEYRDKVLQAAAGMAATPPGAAPGDLPPGPGCDQECALARAGVCRGWERAG